MANLLCISHEWSLGFEALRELADAGFRVISVSTGFDAIRQYAEREIDAIVVNRRLPDIELDELISFLRRHDEGLPVVMLSTVMPAPNIPAGVDAVIQKHGCAGLLVPTLEMLLAGRTPKPLAVESTDTWTRAA